MLSFRKNETKSELKELKSIRNKYQLVTEIIEQGIISWGGDLLLEDFLNYFIVSYHMIELTNQYFRVLCILMTISEDRLLE